MNRTSKKAILRGENVRTALRRSFALLFVCLSFIDILAQDIEDKSPHPKRIKEPFQVLVFLGTDCPISQDYIGILNKINSQFAAEGSIRGIVPEKIDRSEFKQFQKEYQVGFSLELDKNLDLVHKYSITVTPEVVLLDPTGEIRYRGAIDNWYYELGKHRQNVTETYLISAIESFIDGKNIDIKETEPIGCILSKHH